MDETGLAIADAYAAALLQLADEQQRTDEVLDELRELAELIRRDRAFADFLTSAVVDSDARGQVLERVFRGKISDLLMDTLAVMNRKDRAAVIPDLYERYRLAREKARNEIDVEVTTVQALSEGQRHRLVEVLRGRTGKSPQLIERVDPGLIGGMVVRIGDQKLDSSVASSLRSLARMLRDRASREIHAGREYFEAAG